MQARTRTYSWTDPLINAAEIGRRSGLEFLLAMTRGELPPPPIMRTLGIDRIEPSDGRIIVVMSPTEFHYNPLGSCLLYTSPSPRDGLLSRMPSSA